MGLIPGPTQWVKGSSSATAVAEIQSLAQELPNGDAIKKKKKSGIPVMQLGTRNHDTVDVIPGLSQWVKDPALP